VEISDLKEKVEQAEMDKEKVKIELASYKEATQEVGSLLERAEENAALKAELECAKKLLTSYQEKMRASQTKHEEQLSEAREKLRLEQDASLSVQRELENREKQIVDLQSSVRDVLGEKQSLMSENVALTDKLKSYEILCSADSFKLFKLLFKELSNCTVDLECLAQNCIDIYNGKQIDVCSLIGGTSNRLKGMF
jgi:chromosome segregation ATPase